MVANYRCTELKEEAIALVQQPVASLRSLCDNRVVEDFNDQCVAILRQSGDYYAEVAK